MRGVGSALFVGILLMVAGVLNIVYGIAAIGDSHFYVEDTHFVSIGAGEPQGMRTVNPKACPIVPATGACDSGRSDRGISARAI